MQKKIFCKVLLCTGCFWMTTILADRPQGSDYARHQYEQYLRSAYGLVPSFQLSAEHEKLQPDRPDLAGLEEYFKTLDPALKRVPLERLPGAFEYTKSLKTRLIPKGDPWMEHPAAMGGRTRAFMFDPNDPGHRMAWAGAVTGGLWYNLDITSAQSSWVTLSDFWDNLVISSITFDPNNPMIYYVGTGEAQTAVTIYRESSGRGTGIWKSGDGGHHWNLLPSTSGFAYVTDIIVKDENGQSVIYAGVASGLYKGAPYESNPGDGLYRSEDGGSSWIQVLPFIPGEQRSYAVSDIELSPSGRIFVGTMRSLQGKGAGVLLWSDNGTDWTVYENIKTEIESLTDPLINIAGRVMITSSPSDPDRVYAVFSSGGTNAAGFILYKAYALIKSTDGGDHWSRTGMPRSDGSWANLAWHALYIKVDPNNPDVIYAGGFNNHKSKNGGATWEVISDWIGDPDLKNYVHADQHLAEFRNSSSSEMIFTTDGGIFYSMNATSSQITFSERDADFNTIQYYTCAIHPQKGKTLFLGGTQDNGTLIGNGLPTGVEDMISGGDGAYCFIDYNQPDYYITSVYYNRYYVFRNIAKDQYELVNYIGNNQGTSSSGVFINPADYDSRLNTLYANAMTYEGYLPDRILRIKEVFTSDGGEFLFLNTGSGVPFSHVKVSPWSPADNTILFLGTQSGKVFRADNAYTIPQVSEIGSPDFPAANVSCIAVGAGNHELLVSFSNYGVPSVWYTSNGGANWTLVEGNLPDMPVRWALFHPREPVGAILATEIGLWECTDLTAEDPVWSPIGDGFPNVRVDMLQYRTADRTVLAATHGRGFFWKSYSPLVLEDENTTDPVSLFLYPNPAKDRVQILCREDLRPASLLRILNAAGKQVHAEYLPGLRAGEPHNLEISRLSPGIYHISIQAGTRHLYTNLLVVE